jgi:hypothetical protein
MLSYFNQPALGSAILWGDGTVNGDSLISGNTLIWNTACPTPGILTRTASRWYSVFVDPSSLGATDILGKGELCSAVGARVGYPDAWYYPVR